MGCAACVAHALTRPVKKGADTQKKLRAARVLVTGTLGGAAAELCKNLVLAGVNLTVRDDGAVDEECVVTNVFLRPDDVGKPRAECMLPRMLEMNPLASSAYAKASDRLALREFSLVVSSGLGPGALDALDGECVREGVPHIYFESSGMYGFALLNLGASYRFKEQSENYCTLPQLFAASWKTFPKPTKADGRQNNRRFPALFFAMCLARALEQQRSRSTSGEPKRQKADVDASAEDVLKRLQREHELPFEVDAAVVLPMAHVLARQKSFAPTCAILGGLLGNEVVRVLGRTEAPANNVLLFDASLGEAMIRRVAPGPVAQ